MNYENPDHERLDEATRRRLARLAGKPVDTTRLEARLIKAIGPAQPANRASLSKFFRWRPLSRIAAVAAVVVLAGLLFTSMGSNPAIASPADLARVHREMTADDPGLVPATNFAQAARTIQRLWARAPKLPEPTVGQITASCLHNLADREVACLKLEFKGQPITMVVGRSREVVCSAEHRQVTRNGRTYFVHDRDGVRMLMTNMNDSWVCIMGGASLEDLTEVADGLEF